MSDIKIIARTTNIVKDEPSVGDPLSYKIYFEYSEAIVPPNGGGLITNGGAYVPVENLTEAEALANIQSAVVAAANRDTDWLYMFSLDDVRGGWF